MSENIMQFEKVLPPDFDGVFRFTNWAKEDFIGKWGGREYLFPAESTTPMIIPEHSPLEIQNIRKKFAKDLAEKEWFKSKGYKTMADQEGKPGNRTMNSIHQAASYTMSDLAPYIAKCLVPMKTAEILSRPQTDKQDVEGKLNRNEDGSLQSEVIAGGQNWQKSGVSLEAKAKAAGNMGGPM